MTKTLTGRPTAPGSTRRHMLADDAALLERADPAQAGRRAEPDRVGELRIGDSRVLLQRRQDLTVDCVQIEFAQFSTW